MSERLPKDVICSACRQVFPAHKVRRRITLWARLGRGGSLSDVKDQHAEDLYRCDACIREGRQPLAREQIKDLFSQLDEGSHT